MSEILTYLDKAGVGVDTLLLLAVIFMLMPIVWRMAKMAERFEALEKLTEEHSGELYGNGHDGLKTRLTRLEAEHCINHRGGHG